MNRPEINVTPLIDVLLVLLIIFMIITPTKPSSLEAKVPAQRRDTQPADAPPLMLVVTVEKNGELRLNTESLGATVADPELLAERLRKFFCRTRYKPGIFAKHRCGKSDHRKDRFHQSPDIT